MNIEHYFSDSIEFYLCSRWLKRNLKKGCVIPDLRKFRLDLLETAFEDAGPFVGVLRGVEEAVVLVAEVVELQECLSQIL